MRCEYAAFMSSMSEAWTKQNIQMQSPILDSFHEFDSLHFSPFFSLFFSFNLLVFLIFFLFLSR